MQSPILAPAAVLILWSMLMLFWVIITRFSAFSKAKINLAEAEAGTRYQDVESVLPSEVNWKSHNYTHLMEQPTLFYGVVAILALSGAGAGINLILAWFYVALRIVHSLWQAKVNTLPVRIALFAISTTVLFALAVNAVRATLL